MDCNSWTWFICSAKWWDSFKPLHEYDSNIPQNINQKWCFQINFDRNNNLWIASNIGCLHYNFKTREFVHYNQNNKDKYHLSDNYISTIFFDSKGKYLGFQPLGFEFNTVRMVQVL
jgi:hypothetical protein